MSEEAPSPPLRLVVSGASGVLGRALLPLLEEAGAQVVALGRDPARLRETFPSLACCGYNEWREVANGAHAFVHLAVLNNNSGAAHREFHRVNVDFTERLAREASAAGIERFINVSSIHELQRWNRSAYAASKREGSRRLSEVLGPRLFSLYLPYVVSPSALPRKLRWLNSLPALLRKAVISLSAAVKPTVQPQAVASYLIERRWQQRSEVVLSTGQSRNRAYQVISRFVDVLFALIVLAGFWWLLIGIACAIRVDSAGSPIFAQERVGRGGVTFICYKFRTMSVGTPHVATHEVASSAVTRIGKVLRRLKLDELPQAWNLLLGQMSLVGPRPCLPEQIHLVDVRRALGVYEVNPGISGLAQIDGVDMSDPEWLATYDARYVGMQSLAVDWRIILETALGKGNEDRVRNDVRA